MQKYQTIVTAKYEGEIGERREQRILNALEHCGVRVPYHEVLTREQTAAGEMSFTSGDVEWSEEEDEDGYRGELKIYVDQHERAVRLASELRVLWPHVWDGRATEAVMSDRDRIRKLKDKIERRDRSIQLRNQKIARLEKTIAELEGRLKDAGIRRRPPTLTRHRDRRGNEWFSVD